ncbi:MAG: hypothetical protein U0746_03630 [Gemmataceae bacterium]
MIRSTRDAARRLFAVALAQGGYFTAKQAQEAGYGYPHLDYHVSTRAFERVDHGLYRMASLPPGENDDLIRWTLWSRNRADEPQAVVSHETALVHHGLGDLLPSQLHFTVPPTFRKPAPSGCVLHKAALGDVDSEARVGFRVTTPLRTLIDVAAGGVSREQLDKAVADALARGLVRRSQLNAALKRVPGFVRASGESSGRRTRKIPI